MPGGLIFRKYPSWMHEVKWPASEDAAIKHIAERNRCGKSKAGCIQVYYTFNVFCFSHVWEKVAERSEVG